MNLATDEQVGEVKRSLLAAESAMQIAGKPFNKKYVSDISGVSYSTVCGVYGGKQRRLTYLDYRRLIDTLDRMIAGVVACA